MFGIVRVMVAVLIWPSISLAGARIELIPDVPGPYEPGQTMHFAAYLFDTGNPQGDIYFRGLFLDFTDSSPELTYPGLDNVPGTSDDNEFLWTNPFGVSLVFPNLPITSWVYPLSPSPMLMIRLPNDSEVYLGVVNVAMPEVPGAYVLDVMNDDMADPNFGARADFGFGGFEDPVTSWRAHTGELTGGALEITVVPEPGTIVGLVFVGAGAVGLALRRRELTE